jgi:hypothetical protein
MPAWAQRSLPLACSAALACAAAVVAANDPSAANSHFPGCIFHNATGLWCPGCGLTRATHALLTGHPLQALGYNIFTPLVLVAVVLAMVSWTRTSWGHDALATPAVLLAWSRTRSRTITVAAPAALVLYGVLRNIPAAPFRALAP